MRSDIVKVWGNADNIALDLSYDSDGGTWEQNIPPDLTDGQYAVRLYAQNEAGAVGMWTGMLYMTDGIACLHIKREKYMLWLLPERLNIKLTKECATHGEPIKQAIYSR